MSSFLEDMGCMEYEELGSFCERLQPIQKPATICLRVLVVCKGR